MARPEKVRLGEILVQQKLISEEKLAFSLAEQKRTGRKRGRVFVENGLVVGRTFCDQGTQLEYRRAYFHCVEAVRRVGGDAFP